MSNDEDKVITIVDIRDIESIVDAYEECQLRRKEAELTVAEWQESETSFRRVIEEYVLTHAPNPDAQVFIGKINGKRRIRVTVFETTQFHKDKFGEQYPELLEQFSHKAPQVRVTIPKAKKDDGE